MCVPSVVHNVLLTFIPFDGYFYHFETFVEERYVLSVFEDVLYDASDGFVLGCRGAGEHPFGGTSVNLIRHDVAENVNFFDGFKIATVRVDDFISRYGDDQIVAEIVVL